MENRIKEIMAAVFEVDASEINADSNPDTIEKWDSLKHMHLIIALEEEYGVVFEEEEIMNMISFELISLTLKEKLQTTI